MAFTWHLQMVQVGLANVPPMEEYSYSPDCPLFKKKADTLALVLLVSAAVARPQMANQLCAVPGLTGIQKHRSSYPHYHYNVNSVCKQPLTPTAPGAGPQGSAGSSTDRKQYICPSGRLTSPVSCSSPRSNGTCQFLRRSTSNQRPGPPQLLPLPSHGMAR